METAICGRLALSPSHHIFNPKPGDRSSASKGSCTNRGILIPVSATAPGKGGLLDKPVKEKTAPGRESEVDLREQKVKRKRNINGAFAASSAGNWKWHLCRTTSCIHHK